jgi:uncharacterized protein (TIGR03000 family)
MHSDAIAPVDGMIAPSPAVYPSGTGTPIYPSGTGTPVGEPLGTPKENKGKEPEKNGRAMLSSTNAKLVIELPVNAKLFIDDMPVKVSAGVRTFNTPELEAGRAYYYMVRIEMMRDGEPVSETRRIIVHAGQIARADFKELESRAVRTAQAK